MRHLFPAVAVAFFAAAPAAQAQTVMSISTFTGTPAKDCPSLVFISDAGREGLFFPLDAANQGGQSNGGTTLSCGGKLYKRVYDGVVNARWFGLSETSTDNTTAVQNAINALGDGQELLIPDGSYNFGGPIALPANKKTTLTARGTLIFGQHDGIIVEGTHNVSVKSVRGLPYPSFPGVTTPTSGVTLKNAVHSDVRIGQISGFTNGLHVTGAAGAGSQYNRIEFQGLVRNAVGIALSVGSLESWVNENTFTGGRICCETGLYARRGDGGDKFNGNKFYNFGFEGSQAEPMDVGVDVDDFYNNIFVAPRVEQVTSGFKFGSKAFENVIISTALYESDLVSNGQVGNPGARTVFIGKLLDPNGNRTSAFGISDGTGRLLNLIRDANTAVSAGRKLPLSGLPGVTP